MAASLEIARGGGAPDPTEALRNRFGGGGGGGAGSLGKSSRAPSHADSSVIDGLLDLDAASALPQEASEEVRPSIRLPASSFDQVRSEVEDSLPGDPAAW